MYLKLKGLEKYNQSATYAYWIETTLISMIRRYILTIFEEALEGYTDSDYRKAKNENDKIINALYFKLKDYIVASFEKFDEDKTFRCDLVLENTNEDSMVIATPFKKKKHFYYNQKINLLKANGYFKIGEELFTFGEDAFGVLDWGRGVWTYKNTWYWASLNAFNKGDYIGFNLGYGFGDTSKASENMLFYEGRSFKLEDVRFDIPMTNKGKDDYMKPWNIRSANKDIVLTFTPIMDRQDNTNLLVLKSIQNQVFGRFDGYILVEGRKIDINNLLGFAEKVTNYW